MVGMSGRRKTLYISSLHAPNNPWLIDLQYLPHDPQYLYIFHQPQ